MAKDFYVVLQVTRGATPEQIHSAYRRRARELHPDISGKGGDPFIELQQAYSVLSDPAQREAYDQGAEDVPVCRRTSKRSPRPAPEPFRDIEPVSRFREVSLANSFETFTPSFDEMFERLWSNFEELTRPKAEGVESLTVDVPLARNEALAGGTVRIEVPARVRCPACHGHGAVGYYECWQCRGQGAITAEFPLDVAYPAGLVRDYIVQVPLDQFGIANFYLTVRFRPTEE